MYTATKDRTHEKQIKPEYKNREQHSMTRASSLTLGCIDNISDNTLMGWFYSSEYEAGKPTLIVNGSPVTEMVEIKTECSRPDVALQYGIDRDIGFHIDLKAVTSLNRVSTISLLHRESGFDFNSEMLSYCPLVGAYRNKLKDIFLPEYYRYRYGHSSLTNEQAFEQYIHFGIYAGLDPNPWFCGEYVKANHADKIRMYDLPVIAYMELEAELCIAASSIFNAKDYSDENPGFQLQENYLQHFVQSRTGNRHIGQKGSLPIYVREEMKKLGAIEPVLQKLGEQDIKVSSYPNTSVTTYIPALIRSKCKMRPKAMVCVPYLSLGGADLIATYLLGALEQHHGVDEVLLIVTDRSDAGLSKWTREESNIICLYEGSEALGMDERTDLLHSVIGYLKPEKVINVNSNACWSMYERYGHQLSRYIELNSYLFCFDYNVSGHYAGYISDFIPDTIEYLTSVFCDNATIIKDIQGLYGLADSDARKFHTVYVPAPTNLEAVDINKTAEYTKPILWIGRLARQKRPELLLDIAAHLSHLKFVVYGPMGDSPAANKIIKGVLKNVEYRGVYTDFDELDLKEFSLYLNTSAWEGLPTMIIQIMSAGLPVVTSNVGGIAELVNEDTGWLVPHGDNPESYVTELRQVLLHPNVAHAKAKCGKALTQERHSWKSFTKALVRSDCFTVSSKIKTSGISAFTSSFNG